MVSPSSSPASPNPSHIPLHSPLRTYPKRNLPPLLASTYPHGHISGHPRTAVQQAAFEARKAEIRQTMSASQIDARYQDVTKEIRRVLEEARVKTEEVEREIEQLRSQREMERRIWEKLRGERGRYGGGWAEFGGDGF